MRTALILLWIGAFLTPPAFGVEVGFSQLRSQLKQQNPQVKQSVNDVESARLGRDGARWQVAPEVSFRSSKIWGKTIEEDSWTTSRVSHVLGLSWTVFDGFGMWHAWDAVDAQLEKSKYDQIVSDAQVYSALANAYLDWQASVARVEIQRAMVKLREDNWQKVSARVRRGELQRQESLLFENQLLDARDRLIQAESTRDRAVRSLQRILPSTTLSAEKHTPKDQDLFAKDHCAEVKAQLVDHPRLQSLKWSEELANLAKRDATSDLYPTVSLGADHTFNSWTPEVEDPNRSTFNVTLSWTLFDGLSSSYRKRTAVLAEQNARLARQQGWIELSDTVEQNCMRLTNLAQRIKNYEEIVANYRRLYEQGEKQFARAGLSSLDLIRLQTDLLNAQLQQVQLRMDQQRVRMEQTLLYDPVKFPTAF